MNEHPPPVAMNAAPLNLDMPALLVGSENTKNKIALYKNTELPAAALSSVTEWLKWLIMYLFLMHCGHLGRVS